jgi:polyhydroxyalkanoate synthesis repressor PhaR
MGETRVIKRYANRKLYDTQRSRYVTLEQIADMIRSGEDVKIVDNNSKEDLTTITLAQIIFEEEKKQKSFLPLNAMRNIIQSGGERIEELVSQAQKKVSGVFARKPTAGADGAPLTVEETAETPLQLPTDASHEVSGLKERFEEWQRKVDEKVRHALDSVSPVTVAALQKEVNALTARIHDLEERLLRVEKPAGSDGLGA